MGEVEMAMRAWVRAALLGAFAVAITLSHPAAAQTGVSQPTALRASGAHPFPTRAVWPHELMTFQERYDLWLKMRETRSGAERYALWGKKIAELEKRAAEHGLALRDHGPMMMPDDRARMGGEERGWVPHAAPERAVMAGGWQGAQVYGGQQSYGAQGYGGRGYGAEGYGVAPYGAAPERSMMGSGGWQAPHYGGGNHAMPPMGR